MRALAFSLCSLALVVVVGAGPRVRAQSTFDTALLGVSALEAQIAERRAKLERERAHKSTVEAARTAMPEQRRRLERALAADVHALYRLRRGGLLPVADGLDALLSHASRVAHLERMASRTMRALEDMRLAEAQLARELAEAERVIAALEEELLGFESAQAKLVEVPAPARPEPSGEILSVRPADGRMSYGLSLVGPRIEARPSAREPAIETPTGERTPDAEPATYEGSSFDESSRFEAQRGGLAPPVPGASSVTRKQREDGSKGVELVSEPGMSVRAAADGRVVTVKRDESGDLQVVVQHGPRFRTIYAGMASVDVEPGDAISKSARLGSTGSEPIYFEVRHGKRSQDARSWLGL